MTSVLVNEFLSVHILGKLHKIKKKKIKKMTRLQESFSAYSLMRRSVIAEQRMA